MNKSLYDTLGVAKTAGADEIKKAYRRLARKYHPDINKEKNAEEKFKEITAAYEILSDKDKKARYDAEGDSIFGNQGFKDFAHSSSGDNLSDFLNSFFKNSGGFKSQGGGFRSSFGGFEDELDIQANIYIPFLKAVLGGNHEINYNGEHIKLKIPHGIKNGQKLRVKNKGKAAHGLRGDLILIIKIQESDEYERDGDDLYKKLDIDLKTAFFGGSKEVITPRKTLSMKIPPNSKNGQKLRLKGYGVQNAKNNLYGDMYLSLNIILPDTKDLSQGLIAELKKL